MALRVHGIVFAEGHADGAVAGAAIVPFRGLGALAVEVPYELELPDEPMLMRHRTVVEGAFKRGAVLPTPPGTVFRDRRALEQWLELHYVALSDALAFLDDRVEARVYVSRLDGARDEREAGSDLAAVAAETFRVLRRHAVASITVRTEHATGIAVAAAFLVERELWKEFAGQLADEQGRNPALKVELTGPWAPYDFVRMQFGG